LVCTGGTFTQVIGITSGDGPKTLIVRQTDPSGNISPNDSVTVTLDTSVTVVPIAPVISSPTIGTLTNSPSQLVQGTCESGANVNISGNIVGAPVVVACVGGNFSQPVTLTAGDGVKTINANQTNIIGNSPSTSVNLTLDTTAPLAPVIVSPTNGSSSNQVSQTLVGTCESGSTINISGNIVGAPISTACVGGNFSQPVTLTAGDAAKNISATQTDPAGNTSPSTSVNVNLITGLPPAPTITSPVNNSFTNQTAQTVIGACVTGNTVNIFGAGVVGAPVTVVCAAGAYSRAITLTAGQGAKAISATQTDLAGNTSISTNISITFDGTSPSAPVVSAPINGSFTNLIAQTVTGTCEVDATVNISGAGIVGGPIAVACPAGTYSQAVNLTAGDGAKAISATQTDLAGNTSAATNVTVNLDQSNPIAPTITSPVDNSITNLLAQTVTGVCETGASISISGVGVSGGPVATTCPAGTYSQAITLTSGEGAKAINVTQTDSAGNVSPVAAIGIYYDPNQPTVIITSSESSPTAVSPIPYTFAFNEIVENFVAGDITVVNGSVSAFSGGPTVYSVEVTPTAAGDVTVSLSAGVADDKAGNTNLASNVLVIDYQSTPPNAFISQWNIPSNNTNVALPLQSGYRYNFTVDWGDGSPVTTVKAHNDPDINHNYAVAGLYTVTLTGAMQAYGLISAPTCYITYVDQIGYMGWVDLQWMFKNCEQLTDVVANGDEFATVTRMDGMFYGTINSTPTVGHWDISNVGNLGYMFTNTNLANPNVSTWNVSNVSGFYTMFENALAANPDTSNWNTSSATNMSSMFKGAVSVNPAVDGPNWNVSNVISMESMFEGAIIATPQTASWNTGNVTNMRNMFLDAIAANPNTASWDVSQVTNMSSMFRGTQVANPNTSQWRTGNVTNMSAMFYEAQAADPDVSVKAGGVWDVSKVTEFHEMFKGTPIADPDTSGWITTSGSAYYYMFNNAMAANPDVTNWDMTNAGIIQGMFSGAPNATPNVSLWVTPNMYDSAWAFENTPANPDTSNWDFSNNNSMEDMFVGSNISDLNYSKFLNRASLTTTFNNRNLGTVPAQYITDVGNPDVATAARADLVTTRGWSIIDDGPLP
jgi:hypothetical protein